jgi:serine/threonine protein kinase
MERLTSSPYIVNEFGFCGESVLTEYAPHSGRDFIKNKKLRTWERLQIAHDLAAALSDMHSIDYPHATNATLTHNDINIANVIQGDHGRIKFNDFNIGVRMRWNQTKPCGYPVHFFAPLWRSPEEILATNTSVYVHPEKSDIYGLGNLLFQVLTTHQPWTWLEPGGRLSVEEVIEKKLDGEYPHIPHKFYATNKTGVVAIFYATMACYAHDPEDRPTSYELEQALGTALEWVKAGKFKSPDEVKRLFHFRNVTQQKARRTKRTKHSASSGHGSNQNNTTRNNNKHTVSMQQGISNKTKALLSEKDRQMKEAAAEKESIARRLVPRPKIGLQYSGRQAKRGNKAILVVEEANGMLIKNQTLLDMDRF